MTKNEAIAAMERGEKVSHNHFCDDEYMTIVNGRIVFENGCSCTQSEFWNGKSHDSWQKGYRLFK